MIWVLAVAVYLVGSTWLMHRDLVAKMVESKYEHMDDFDILYKEPEKRLKEVREAKTEALLLSLAIGVFGCAPFYFGFRFLQNRSFSSRPVCDRELRDQLAVRENYIKQLEKEVGVQAEGR